MEKLAEGTYMDRLVVTEDVDGRLSTHILRYRTSEDWLARRASGKTGWEDYSGDIAIFDGEGDPRAAGHFNGGQVTAQDTSKGTAGKSDEMDCTITDISLAGLEQDGVFYVTDIIIEYECSGSGTNDGDPDPGLDNGGGEFPQNEGPQGGGGGGSGNGEQIPMVIEDELVLEDEPVDPSCESFDYYKVGNTGVQVAGVNGVWDVVTKWGKCPGIGVAASYQTYYFHLPANWDSNYAAERSADALAGAFFDLQKWFQKQSCSQMNTGVLALKMDEFIKENFQEIGGQATRNAPLGWLGIPRQYKEDWSGTDDCY